MDLRKATEILERHSRWRLGIGEKMPNTARELTEAFAVVLAFVKKRLKRIEEKQR